MAVSQVEPDSRLTSLLLAFSPFVASLEETAASHKKPFTARRRSANMPLLGESCLAHLALPVLPESGASQNCVRVAQLQGGSNVGQRVSGQSRGWAETSWITERTKQLSAIDRQERAGPDKRGEVYQESSSTEEETPSRGHPHLLLPPSNCRNRERKKNGCN